MSSILDYPGNGFVRLVTALRRTPRAAKETRLVIVSNRLPISIEQENGTPRVRHSTGGLVSALGPVLHDRGGLWIGWPGAASQDVPALNDLLIDHGAQLGYALVPVALSGEEVHGFYQGFCNEIIWPLFHDLQSRCNFVPGYWTQCMAVTQRYANVVHANVWEDDFIWVQDYHLIGLGRQLRDCGVRNRIGFFLHIPFPPPDIYCKLPWRTEVLESMLTYDVIGLQSPRDRDNFLDCVKKLLPKAHLRSWRGVVRCNYNGALSHIGTFPIGIDHELFSTSAASPAITERVIELRSRMPGQQILLGLDRLDYTKGVPCRLRAFELALRKYENLRRAVTLLQVVVPSREAVPEYQDLKAQIERLVTQINGEFTQPGWVPIHYVFRHLDWEDLISYYRVSDVALVTPLKDGMNLVAKEYCACQTENNGVMILSEFAGAAAQMARGAILVNPYDLEHVADAIQRAVCMTPAQREPAMRRLRRLLRRQDVFWWADRFLGACGLARVPATGTPAPPAAMVG